MGEEARVIQGIQEDLRSIKDDLAGIRKDLNSVAVQEERISAMGRDFKALRESHLNLEGKVQAIKETCIARERLVRLGEQHLLEDETAPDFWNRLLASGASSGFWIIVSGLIGMALTRVLR